MKFFAFLPLVLALSAAQDFSSEAAKEAASKIVDFVRPLLGKGNPNAFDTILDSSFVYQHCDYGTFKMDVIVKLISSYLAAGAQFELNTASFLDNKLDFNVQLTLGNAYLLVYFKAKPSDLNKTGYVVISGQTLTCA